MYWSTIKYTCTGASTHTSTSAHVFELSIHLLKYTCTWISMHVLEQLAHALKYLHH